MLNSQNFSDQKKGVLYAPFASEDIISMSIGRNIGLNKLKKPDYPLIAKNSQDKMTLEQCRQKLIVEFTKKYKQTFNNTIQSMRRGGMSLGMIRHTIGPKEFDANMMLSNSIGILENLEILSNENGHELAKLKANLHKIYIIGHGKAGADIIAADEECKKGMVTAGDIAKQFSEGGLDKAFWDFRVSICYSADAREPLSFQPNDLLRAAKPESKRTGFLYTGPRITVAEPFAQTLSNALHKAGFNQVIVTGYHGAGLMFSTEHQMRCLLPTNPDNTILNMRSSLVKQQFKPTL